MASFDDFKEKVQKGPGTPEHDVLLKHCMNLIKKSRAEMGKHYSTWDYHDQVFRSRKVLDKEDRSANAKGQPAKMIIPLTFAQVMTFVAFSIMTTTQNQRFYELVPTGTRFMPLKEPIELILERDLRRNSWSAFLFQFFLDIGKFCFGAAEICYKEEFRMVRIPQTTTLPGAFGLDTTQTTSDFQKIPTFVGNKVYPVSPYRIFPDVDLPLTRFQEGKYCASEDMFTIEALRSDADNLFSLDKIPKMSEKEYVDRRKNTRIDVLDFMPIRNQPPGDGIELGDKGALVKTGGLVVTKVVLDIIPNDFTMNAEEDKPLGTEKFPIRYIVWYANDKTVIRFEEAYFLHGQFPYIIAQMMPDQQKLINEGLSDTCDQLQNTCTWLTNAHVTSIRSCMEGGKFILDPAGIDIKGLNSRSPYIFLKKNASQTGVDRYIKQFTVTDVTAGFMNDVAGLKELMEDCTGYSKILQGSSSDGRRSATQDRAVIQSGSARAKTTLSTIWDTAFVSLGKQFIANNRQEMDHDTFARIIGPQDADPLDPNKLDLETLYILFKADPITIATAEDFFVFDATLPSEKSFLAQSLQEILVAVMSNPEMAQILGYGAEQIKQLFDEIYELRGVNPPYMPKPAQPPTQPPGIVPMQPPPQPNPAQLSA